MKRDLTVQPTCPSNRQGVAVEADRVEVRFAGTEDDEAVRPDGGDDLARRDRTHRDLGETRRAVR